MSGPDGMQTNRDKRREARRQQLQRTQRQRQQVRKQQIRTQRIQRGAMIAAGVFFVILVAALIFFAVHGGTGTGTVSTPPKTVDGLTCVQNRTVTEHTDTYVELYANDQQQTIPTGIGIEANCSYPLTVQPGQANVITASSSTSATYTLSQFFDIWGKPLSSTQVAQYAANNGGHVTIEIWDGQGHFSFYSGDPRSIPLQNHETIAILVNSPNAHPLPYSNWSSVTK